MFDIRSKALFFPNKPICLNFSNSLILVHFQAIEIEKKSSIVIFSISSFVAVKELRKLLVTIVRCVCVCVLKIQGSLKIGL